MNKDIIANTKQLLLLQPVFILYSIGTMVSKTASQYDFFEIRFVILYSLLILILATYAYFWQKILKKYDLSIAYSNRGTILLWTFLFAIIAFGEKITWNNIIGGIVIMAGIVMVGKNDE